MVSSIVGFVTAPPVITRTWLEDLTIIAGEDIILSVNFVGVPPPFITWLLNGMEMRQSDRITFQKRDDFARVLVNGCNVSDTGTYELTLSNSAGEVNASCIVTVYGKSAAAFIPL